MQNRIAEILRSVYKKLAETNSIDRFYALLYNPQNNELEFPLVIENNIETQWQSRQYDQTLLPDRTISLREPIHYGKDIADILQKEGLGYYPSNESPPLSWLSSPMIVRNNVLGALVIENKTFPDAFGDSSFKLMSAFAKQAAIGIENAKLYERVNRKTKSLEAIHELGVHLTSQIQLSEQNILELIHQQAKKVMDTDNMYIALYEPDTNQPDIFIHENHENNRIFGTIHFGLMYLNGKPKEVSPRKAAYGDYGRTEVIIQNRQSILIKTKEESIKWYQQPGRKEFIDNPLASWIGVPMIIRGKVIGVIATYHEEKDYIYDDDDLQYLIMMANHAAVAIENSKLYSLLQQRTEELQQLNNTLEEKVKERTKELEETKEKMAASEALAGLGAVSASLQHRINSTLAILSPNIARVKRSIQADDLGAIQAIDIMERNIDYLSRIIKQLLRPFKKEEKVLFNVETVIHTLIKEFSDTHLPDTVIKFESTFEQDCCCRAGIGHISEVFRNLIQNACESMIPEGGTLRIHGKCCDHLIEVRIMDTGKGFPEDILPRIFKEPVPPKHQGRGAGLGLWLSRIILQQYGGTITVEQTGKGEGATVLVKIPSHHETRGIYERSA